MINKKEFPLVLLRGIKNMHVEVKKIIDENKDIIAIKESSELEIAIKDISSESNFYFTISNPRFDRTRVVYTGQYKPKNTQTLDFNKFTSELPNILNNLKIWIKFLREYDQIDITPEEKILNQYEKEFYSDFEILDEDAETNPFDLKRQIIIHKFLDHTVEILSNDENENEELIKDSVELKNDIPKLTKKETVKRLSRLLAKIRKKSLTLLKDILEVAKKELYKKAIGGGFKMIGEFIDLMT